MWRLRQIPWTFHVRIQLQVCLWFPYIIQTLWQVLRISHMSGLELNQHPTIRRYKNLSTPLIDKQSSYCHDGPAWSPYQLRPVCKWPSSLPNISWVAFPARHSGAELLLVASGSSLLAAMLFSHSTILPDSIHWSPSSCRTSPGKTNRHATEREPPRPSTACRFPTPGNPRVQWPPSQFRQRLHLIRLTKAQHSNSKLKLK